MCPEVKGIVGTTQFAVAVHEDYVVAGVNLLENAMTAYFVAAGQELASSILTHEASLKVGLVVDKSQNELLALEQYQTNQINGNLHAVLS